jgi:hypothetical protein
MDTEYYRSSATSGKVQKKWFEGKWLKEDGVGEVVQNAWESRLGSDDVMAAVESVQKALHAWESTVLKKPRVKLRTLSRQLEEVLRREM